MSGTLYVTDLDGTLLGPDGLLSDFTRGAVTRLLDAGVPLALASARSAQSMRPMVGGLPLRLPVVAMNGAFLTDLATGRHERICAIPLEAVTIVLRAGESAGLVPFVTSHDGASDNLYVPLPDNDGMAWYRDDRRRVRDPRLREGYDGRAWLGENIVSLTFIGARDVLAPLSAAIAEQAPTVTQAFTAHIYSVGWYWLTLHAAEATKARGVAALRRLYGFEAHRLVAFGDQANDIPLLRYADHGVAVANADAEVKAVVREVIGPNTEDSVARYLLRAAGL